MSRTFRRDRKTEKKVRDGQPQFASKSCEHHGGCPWCERNRLFNFIKASTAEKLQDVGWR